MGIKSINCSLVCFNSQKEQTKSSRNFRITAVVLGILLAAAGLGIALSVGSFGWALIAAGIVSFMIGTCCFYPKKEKVRFYTINSNDEQQPRLLALRTERGPLINNALNNLHGGESEVEDWQKRAKALSDQITELQILAITKGNLEECVKTVEDLKEKIDQIKKEAEDLLVSHPNFKTKINNEIGEIEKYFKRREERIEEIKSAKTEEVVDQRSNQNSQVSDPAKAHEALMTKILTSEDPANAYNDNLQKMQDLKRQEWENQADALKQVQKWEKKLDDLHERALELSKVISLENLEECKKQRANLQVEFKKLENEPEIATLKSIYNSVYKSRLDGKFKMVSNYFRMFLDDKIERIEKSKIPSSDATMQSQEVITQNKSEVTTAEDALQKWEEKLKPLWSQIFTVNPSKDPHAKENLKEYEAKIVEFEQSLNQLKKEAENIPNRQRADDLMKKVEALLINRKQKIESLKTSKSPIENPIQSTTSPLPPYKSPLQNLLSQSQQQILNPQGRDLVEKSEYKKNAFENFLNKQDSLMEKQRSEWEAKNEQEQQAQPIKTELINLHSEIFAYFTSVDTAKEGLQQVEQKLEDYKSKFEVIKAKPFIDHPSVKTYSDDVTFIIGMLTKKIEGFKQTV